jgi:acyl-CoA thioester hydrolase
LSARDTLPPHRARILPEWIDYNGHLRDAYYAVILSDAVDGVMDHLGLDAAYRARTHCTLYTLELHMHYLHEDKEHDSLSVETLVLDADSKRIHAGCRIVRGAATPEGADARAGEIVATGDMMLLHVRHGETPASAPFPSAIAATLSDLKLGAEAVAQWGPRSRPIEIKRRPG